MLPSTYLRKVLFACAPSLYNLPSFTVESTISFPCFHSDPPLSHKGAVLAHLDSIPPQDLVIWIDDFVLFPFGKGGSGILANCLLCGTEAIFLFSASLDYSSLPVPFCNLSAGLGSTNKTAISLLSDSHSVLFCLSIYHNLFGKLGRNCLLSPPLLAGYNGSTETRFYWGLMQLMSWPDGECYSSPLQSYVVSLLLLLESTILSSQTGGVLSHQNSLIHRFPRFPPKNLCSLCSLSFLLQWTKLSVKLLSHKNWQN